LAQEQIEQAEKRPRQGRKQEIILGTAALLVIVLDQLSKHYVRTYLPRGVPWNPIESLSRYVSFTYITNTGAAFGILPAFGTIFTFIAIIAVVAILLYYRRLASESVVTYLALGLQLGGALGNLVDRIRLGYVVDFIDFKVWPVFNVADSSVVVGVALLALSILREPDKDTKDALVSDGRNETQ